MDGLSAAVFGAKKVEAGVNKWVIAVCATDTWAEMNMITVIYVAMTRLMRTCT